MKNELKLFMDTVPFGRYNDVKNRIKKECGITDFIWKNWIGGKTKVPTLAKPVIEKIAEQKIFSS